MIIGCGLDFINIRRAEEVFVRQKERALQRLLRPSERTFYAKSPALGFAKIWACKEAMIKALGQRPEPFSWHDFEILHTDKGQPSGRLYGAALRFLQAHPLFQAASANGAALYTIFLSITDESPFAAAVCIIEIL